MTMAQIYLHKDGTWLLCGTDTSGVIETITTLERFQDVIINGDPGRYWIRGDLGTIGGIYGADRGSDPADWMIFQGHPDGSARMGNMYLQACSGIRFERINWTSSVELRMHTSFITHPHHIQFSQCVWDGIDVYFCLGVSNTFEGSSVEDILVDRCRFTNLPVPQTPEQDWSQWDNLSGQPGFDANYALYLIGGNGTIKRATVTNNVFSHVLNDACQVASLEGLVFDHNLIEYVAYYSRTIGGRHADPLQSQSAFNVEFTNNIIRMCDQPLQLQDGNHDWLIDNNLIIGTHGPGFGFGHFWGHAPGDPYGGPTDIGLVDCTFTNNTVWDVGVDDGGYPAGLWRGAGHDNIFHNNFFQRALGEGQSAWDTPLGVGSGKQFSSAGGNFLLNPIPGSSPADISSPSPAIPAMNFTRGTTPYLEPNNWVPVEPLHSDRGYRP
jgi:hypothetical protein